MSLALMLSELRVQLPRRDKHDLESDILDDHRRVGQNAGIDADTSGERVLALLERQGSSIVARWCD